MTPVMSQEKGDSNESEIREVNQVPHPTESEHHANQEGDCSILHAFTTSISWILFSALSKNE